MDESLDIQMDMSTGRPEATTSRPSSESSNSDLHTVPPAPTDFCADETQVLTTTGVRDEHVPAPATTQEPLLLTPAPPTDETQVLTTTGAHEEHVPAPATMQESLSTPALPTNASLPEVLPQLANGPAPKKRKVAARAITSNSISDKYGFVSVYNAFLIVPLGIYVDKIGSRVTTAAQRTSLKCTGSIYPKRKQRHVLPPYSIFLILLCLY